MLIAHRMALDPNNAQATCFARAAGSGNMLNVRKINHFQSQQKFPCAAS